MANWQLGVDFGTSYTVAAVLEEDQVTLLDVESNGQSRIPSVAFLNSDGDLLVGTNAQHQAVFAPERYEPAPKRCVADGEVFLGDDFVPVATLIAAVLRKVYTEACRQHNEVVPSATRVTHPAEWADARLNVLRSAIEAAGLPNAVLIPEPVAAAAWIAMAATSPGSRIAVYDFGGGTFDAAVLRRTEDGFEVAGPPSGRDPLGGEDLDRLIINYLGAILENEGDGGWSNLMNPQDASWRRAATALRAEVQRAKETLSDVLVCQLWVPGLEREMQLTRSELEQLILPSVEETVASLKEAISAAQLGASDLAGIYLVGGSSRIPLVADTIWRELGVQPMVQDHPKSVVAMGAAAWGSSLHTAAVRAGAIGETRGATRADEQEPPRFQSHLVMVKGSGTEDRGSVFTSLLVAELQDGPTIRLRDEPAQGRDVLALANQSLEVRASRMTDFVELAVEPVDLAGLPGGLERRFRARLANGPVEMFERYVVSGDRAIVLAAPEEARAATDSVRVEESKLPVGRYFEPRVSMAAGPGWTVSERLTLLQAQTGHQITADHVLLPALLTADQWRERQVAALLRAVPGAVVMGTEPSRVLNRLEGEEVLVRSNEGRVGLLTRLQLALVDGIHAYEVTITLRERDRALFSSLASIALLNPSVTSHRADRLRRP